MGNLPEAQTYMALLCKAGRADRKHHLLRDRLSHLAEGHYDLQGDVSRPGKPAPANPATATTMTSAPVPMICEPTDADLASTVTAFRRFEGVAAVKANVRQRKADS